MPQPTERVRNHFIGYAKKLLLDYEDILNTHPGDLGENRERGIEVFLKQHLPPAYQVFRGGKVIDMFGEESQQVDILICNSLIPQLVTENKTLYFVEGVMGAIEGKSFLTKTELKDCLIKCKRIKQLAKTYEPGTEVFTGESFEYKLNKVHFSVFAYDSPELKTVANNLVRISAEMGLDVTMEIDCICILKKGIIFKRAYPGLDGELGHIPPVGTRISYIFKPLEFEGLAYFLLQLQREFQYIKSALFDMTKYAPQFQEDWYSQYVSIPKNPNSET